MTAPLHYELVTARQALNRITALPNGWVTRERRREMVEQAVARVEELERKDELDRVREGVT